MHGRPSPATIRTAGSRWARMQPTMPPDSIAVAEAGVLFELVARVRKPALRTHGDLRRSGASAVARRNHLARDRLVARNLAGVAAVGGHGRSAVFQRRRCCRIARARVVCRRTAVGLHGARVRASVVPRSSVVVRRSIIRVPATAAAGACRSARKYGERRDELSVHPSRYARSAPILPPSCFVIRSRNGRGLLRAACA